MDDHEHRESRAATWNARIDAHWLARYYGACASSFGSRERFFEAAAALCGSGAVVAWCAAHASPLVPALSVIAVFFSTVPVVSRYARWAAECEIASRHWMKRARDWDSAWSRIEAGHGLTLADVAAMRAVDADFEHPSGSTDERLADRCHVETLRVLAPAAAA